MIRIDSKGMGKTHADKTIRVHTNDSNTPEIKLSLSGEIKPFVDLSSSVIRLTGSAGKEIKRIITISPVEGNRFRITGVAPEDGKHLEYELAETTHAGALKYELTVINVKREKGWYKDNFRIRTDSTISPEFGIPVFGFIREP